MNITQQENLDRVRSKIQEAILEFANQRIGQAFHADDLRRYVASQCQVAPGSSDRVLRDLRQRGLVGYQVINRRQSLYLFVAGDQQ